MTPFAAFPRSRPRRLRRTAWVRAMVAEVALAPRDLILPVFVLDGTGQRQPVASMPGVDRLSIDLLVGVAEEAARLGIPAMALFPVTQAERKTDDGREAWNDDNLVCLTRSPPTARTGFCVTA